MSGEQLTDEQIEEHLAFVSQPGSGSLPLELNRRWIIAALRELQQLRAELEEAKAGRDEITEAFTKITDACGLEGDSFPIDMATAVVNRLAASRPTTEPPTEWRCLHCGGLVTFDGTKPGPLPEPEGEATEKKLRQVEEKLDRLRHLFSWTIHASQFRTKSRSLSMNRMAGFARRR